MPWKRLQNPELQKRLKQRSRIIKRIRDFFVSKGFMEIETPIMTKFAGQEPHLDPIRVKGGRYLITSPEYSHKKLLAAGFRKTFEITKCFRGGEPLEGLHNPEFTMIEWYRSEVDYMAIMKDVEKMVQYAGGKNKIIYQGKGVNISSPWERITMRQAWEKYANISKGGDICSKAYLKSLCKQKGYSISNNYDDLFFKIFLTDIEPKLGFKKPTIIYKYPKQMAALSKVKGKWAERFELYIAGIEIANAFSELNNKEEQEKRFMKEQKIRKDLKKEIIPLDRDFLDAIEHMPKAAGIALGVDRLIMVLTDAERIEDVLCFPEKEREFLTAKHK